MKRLYLLSTLLWFAVLAESAYPQSVTQTIRGQVTDAASGTPLPGVNILVLDQERAMGASTLADGSFRIENVPVGRRALRFSFLGYETEVVSDLVVTSAREVVLTVTLRESVSEMEALVVTPTIPKDQTINTMSVAGGRLLSMEEASRFAGGFDDPARLVSSFAGVAGSLADNAVVIRGNAPKGVLWQMEGVSIPTPSHFANILTIGGGGITALSSQMISDSDFFTGAFPAEYGNALSGVFDLNLRNGNSEQYEHLFKAGAIGLDVASEGPLPVSEGASYLFNYRYSTFSLLTPLLPEDAGGIRYQNLSWKINIPLQSAGTFSFWGIGANDRSGQTADPLSENWVYNQDREEGDSPTRLGAAGVTHRIITGDSSYLTTTAALTGNGLEWELRRYRDDGSELWLKEQVRSESGKATLTSVFNFKTGAWHSNRTGFVLNRLGYNQFIRHSSDADAPLLTVVDKKGDTALFQAFSQSRFDFGKLSVTAGFHLMFHRLISDTSFEPRLGFEYRAGAGRYSLSYGRHSFAEPLSIYFSSQENRRLGLSLADHLVAGYSRIIGPDTHIKIDVYYQKLSDIPVRPGSGFSVINMEQDWFVSDRLTGDGSGRNYGAELTLEKNMSDGWYAMASGSIFKSRYRGGDGVWRGTRFDRGYTAVLLGGREWELHRESRVRIIGINARINFMGGKRMSPVDTGSSHQKREVVVDEGNPFSQKEPPVIYADLGFEYRTIRRRVTSTWSLQLLNVTGYREFYGYRYNLRNNTIDEEREMILIPNLAYKIEF